MNDKQPIIVIGAGPTGIGAARRLQELGADWLVLEKERYVGGLAASFTDEGYVWDIGGHVIFSHYRDYDDLLTEAVAEDEWVHHARNAQVLTENTWVPYPFQSNLHALPEKHRSHCLAGLENVRGLPPDRSNFGRYIRTHFGEGITESFMRPYNEKIWAHPLESMSVDWITERVASVRSNSEGSNWGPNNRFLFPAHGGTGAIWKNAVKYLPDDRFILGDQVEGINPGRRELTTTSGETYHYGTLISTMPIDRLAYTAGLGPLVGNVPGLCHTSVHIVGLGISGPMPETIEEFCWMYFPEPEIPFYRATVFSRYSPNNAPPDHWSLMLEISESPYRTVSSESLVHHCIDACVGAGLINRCGDVSQTWQYRAEYGYPVPTLGRDRALKALHGGLEPLGIFSRGRFGAWRYEIGNMDHCYMQGREIAERIVLGAKEKVAGVAPTDDSC